MIYVFEDDGRDRYSELFNELYTKDKIKTFVNAGGNGNLETVCKNILISVEDNVIVFMDIVPDNTAIRRIYYNLKVLSAKYDNRLIILPIICAEYNFIQTVKHLITDQEVLQRCINKQPYYDLIPKFSNQDFIKNFERFCKAIIYDFAKDCIKSKESNNERYNFYFKQDCPCNKPNSECMQLSIKQKALNYACSFPCIPGDAKIKNYTRLTIDDLWNIHRECIIEINKMIDNFNTVSIKKISKRYANIKQGY